MTTFIYGLLCPRAQRIRYIGKSTNPPKRLSAHIKRAEAGIHDHHAARWIRSLLRDGLRPQLVILHEVRPDECWIEVESRFIREALAKGWPLTNTTAGGDGLRLESPDARAEVVARMRAAALRRTQTPEARERLSKQAAEAWKDEAYRAAVSKGCSAANTPEARAARSAKMKAQWATDREALAARFGTSEERDRRARQARERWADPAFRARMSALYAERREVRAAASRAVWERRRRSAGEASTD